MKRLGEQRSVRALRCAESKTDENVDVAWDVAQRTFEGRSIRRVPVTCDVLVVGLGAVGSSATYQLARAGVRVVGLDQFAPPHALGSSHGDTRITRLAVGEGSQYVPHVRRSHALWREIEEESGQSLLVACGGLIVGRPSSTGHRGVADFTAATIELARENHIDHEVLTADQIRERFGVFAVTDEIGYFEPTAGYLRAEACVKTQLVLAERAGATIRRDEGVIAWHSNAEGVRVESRTNTYEAASLVLAGGPWMSELVPDLAPYLSVEREVMHWFEIGGDAARFESNPVFIWMHGSQPGEYFYGFPAVDGPFGDVKVAAETFGVATTPEVVDRSVRDEESSAFFDAHLRGRVPGLRPHCRRAVTCLYTVTPDFGFIVDALPGRPNVVVVSACSGHGFKHAASIGECAAHLALGAPPPVDVSAFSLSRFTDPAVRP